MPLPTYSLILYKESTYESAITDCLGYGYQKLLYVNLGTDPERVQKALGAKGRRGENLMLLELPMARSGTSNPGGTLIKITELSELILQTATNSARNLIIIDNFALLLDTFPRELVLAFANELASWRPAYDHKKIVLHNIDFSKGAEGCKLIEDMKLFVDQIIDRGT